MQNLYRLESTDPTALDTGVESSSFQLVLDDVAYHPGGHVVLDGVRQSVALGERIGVIGENGAGKSTLLRLIAGIIQPDSGRLRVRAPGGVGYLPQVPQLAPEQTVGDAIDHALADLRALDGDLRTIERAMSTAKGDELETLLARYGELLEAFEARDGYAADARVEAAMHGLGLAELTFNRRLGSMSGGEQARLDLACTLAAAPQLMLLDEPTNHLDAAALEWLEDHLSQHSGSLLVVSHDRVFLEQVVGAVWEMDGERHIVHRHGGGYAGYLRARATARRRWEQQHQEWREELAEQRELARRAADGLASGVKRKTNADRTNGRHQRDVERQMSARVRNAKERVRRLEENPVQRPPQPMRFRARVDDTGGRPTGPVADLFEVAVADRLAVRSFTVEPSERILVTGPNGAGKSTLLRILAGELAPDRGECRRPQRVGWLPQVARVVDPDQSLLAAFAAGKNGDPDQLRGALLRFGLFRPSNLATAVGALSVGQRRRLALARTLSEPSDLLLLDEPTNHLSPALVEELEEALAHYRGALVVVSHDRMLARRFTGRRVQIEEGRIVD